MFDGFNIVTHRAYLSQPRTATKKLENVASLCLPARAHITTPTRSVPEVPEIRVPPYYGHILFFTIYRLKW